MTYGSWEKKISQRAGSQSINTQNEYENRDLERGPYSCLKELKNFVLSMTKPTTNSAAE